MQADFQYMVDFTLPDLLSEEFMGMIPHQRAKVNRLFRDGKLVNYALSLEHSKMWAVFNANSESEVMEIVDQLPLSKFMSVQVSMLTFYNALNEDIPVFSLN
jgi:muconolactone delta-isomerase